MVAPPRPQTMDADDRSTASSGLSSPLSEHSRSPTPPSEFRGSYMYPSPSCSSSDLSSLGSTPTPDSIACRTPPSTQSDDDSPPKKRRKLNDDKERTSAHLDLRSHQICEDEQKQLDKLLKVLHKRRKIVVVAGAGISVSAGIPDFRSSTGLFKTLKREHNLKSSGKDLFDASVYKNGDSTTTFHAMIRNLSTATKDAEPTPFHHLLATLAQEGRLLRLYSQNVDGIDTSLSPLATQVPLPKKGPWPKTIQLHGTLEHMTCTKCHRISDFVPDLFDGPSPPPCQHCEETDGIRTQHAGKRSHGIGVLRPRMVLYNEHNPDDEAIGSVVKADLRTRPDALIVVGTTLKVPGVKRIVKEMCGIVRDRKDGITIWINNDPPPALKDYEWDLVVQGPCDHVANHAAMRHWDQPEPELQFVSEDQVEKIKRENGTPEVIINMSPSKKNKVVEGLQGVITPAPSPKIKPLAPATATNGTVVIPATAPAATVKGSKAMTASKKQTTLAGAKRNVGGKNTTKKAPAKNPAAKKTTAKQPNNKKSNEPTFKINLKHFRQGKPNVPPVAVKSDDAKQQAFSKSPAGAVKPKHDIFTVDQEIVVDVMQPLSPSSARNNGSPPYSAPTSSTTLPQKSGAYREAKNYGALTVDTSRRTPIRESPEERRRTITPPSVPRNTSHLFL